VITIIATVGAIGTALLASGCSNLMDYLQQLFSFFNAPLFATFILGMFWKRMTPTAEPGAGNRGPRTAAQRSPNRAAAR
jgi:solute:Na+ symporter, SSS family